MGLLKRFWVWLKADGQTTNSSGPPHGSFISGQYEKCPSHNSVTHCPHCNAPYDWQSRITDETMERLDDAIENWVPTDANLAKAIELKMSREQKAFDNLVAYIHKYNPKWTTDESIIETGAIIYECDIGEINVRVKLRNIRLLNLSNTTQANMTVFLNNRAHVFDRAEWIKQIASLVQKHIDEENREQNEKRSSGQSAFFDELKAAIDSETKKPDKPKTRMIREDGFKL